jgi:acetyl esterase/lipase
MSVASLLRPARSGRRSERARRRYRDRFWPFGVLAALLLGGCSPAAVLNAIEPRRGTELTRSVSYGEGPRQTLDVYRPIAAASAPVVVFLYGGSWQFGHKETYQFLGRALARRGYVVVVPDYRVYPEARYPAFLEDNARAVRWAKDNAVRFGGNPNELFLMGHSAGAYDAAMLALDKRWLNKVDIEPGRDIAGLIGLSGPYDFLPLRDETLKTIFGGADDPTTQPISYVAPGAPRTLLLTGGGDEMVEPSNSVRLAARLRAVGDDVTLVTYPRVGHITMIGSFALPLRFIAPALRDVDAFIARTVNGAADVKARQPADVVQ